MGHLVVVTAAVVASTGCESIVRDVLGLEPEKVGGAYDGEWKVRTSDGRERRTDGRVILRVPQWSSEVSGSLVLDGEAVPFRGRLGTSGGISLSANGGPFATHTHLRGDVDCQGGDYGSCAMTLSGNSTPEGTQFRFEGKSS